MPTHHFATYDVVIIGAGPVGLFLACELRLAGVSVLVLGTGRRPALTSQRVAVWHARPVGADP